MAGVLLSLSFQSLKMILPFALLVPFIQNKSNMCTKLRQGLIDKCVA